MQNYLGKTEGIEVGSSEQLHDLPNRPLHLMDTEQRCAWGFHTFTQVSHYKLVHAFYSCCHLPQLKDKNLKKKKT